MLLFRKPAPETVRGFLSQLADAPFSYQAVGATQSEPPRGYTVDHTRVLLGQGDHAFAAARIALEGWRQFQLGWLSAWPDDTPIREGEAVAIVAHAFRAWWLNACRIVYVIDDDSHGLRFGFAYGTLSDHAGRGEERFLIEMDQQESVWYDILAFSRPGQPLSRIGYPYMRRLQRQFGRQSSAEMKRIVGGGGEH